MQVSAIWFKIITNGLINCKEMEREMSDSKNEYNKIFMVEVGGMYVSAYDKVVLTLLCDF